MVEACAIPWLQQHSTIQGLKALAEEDYDALLHKVAIWRAAYDYLRAVDDVAFPASR